MPLRGRLAAGLLDEWMSGWRRESEDGSEFCGGAFGATRAESTGFGAGEE